MRCIRLVAEHYLPSAVRKKIVKLRMNVLAMRANVNSAHFSPQQIDKGRKDENFGLLNVGFQIVDNVEGTKELVQRDGTDKLDLGCEIMTWNEIARDPRCVVHQQISQRVFSPTFLNKCIGVFLARRHLVG